MTDTSADLGISLVSMIDGEEFRCEITYLDLSNNCPVVPMLDGVQSVRVDEQSAGEEERHEKIVKTFSQLIDSC